MYHASFCLFPLALLLGVPEAEPSREPSGFFERRIRPVLVEHCYPCHSARAAKVRGGLRLNSREGLRAGGETGPAIVPGDPAASLLLKALRYEGPKMPPSGRLPDQVIADFQSWIQHGAPDPRAATTPRLAGKQIECETAKKFWAFQPPEAFDIGREPESIRALYGETPFGQSCLLARRLVERGVRFVQVYYLDARSNQPWDTHQDNDKRHRSLCADSDRATAALLVDLKHRGLLQDTLVLWGGEFGRTPYAQPTKTGSKKAVGRDHHHTGFTMLLAGSGVRGGLTYGATDELGMQAVENRVHVHDLHATILHLLGIDHEKLTYRYNGRDFRLTDVYGRVVRAVIA